MTDDEIRKLERESPNDPALVGRLARTVQRAGGIPYALDRIEREPDSKLWQEVYLGVGGMLAELVHDPIFGQSLRATLPNYQGRREEVILKLSWNGELFDIEQSLTQYTAREHGGARDDGIIMMPLRLELAIADGMRHLIGSRLFRHEVAAYNHSFVESVQQAQPAYGKITDQQGTLVTLDELTLDGRRVQTRFDLPFLDGSANRVVLAPAQDSLSREPPILSSTVEQALENLTDLKNPGLALQTWASPQAGLYREIQFITTKNFRGLGTVRALGLGTIDYRDTTDIFYIDACDTGNGQERPVRRCKRARP